MEGPRYTSCCEEALGRPRRERGGLGEKLREGGHAMGKKRTYLWCAALLTPVVVGAGLLAFVTDTGRQPDAGRRLDADKIGAAAETKATTKGEVVRIEWP